MKHRKLAIGFMKSRPKRPMQAIYYGPPRVGEKNSPAIKIDPYTAGRFVRNPSSPVIKRLGSDNLVAISLLRGIAALMVVWDHLAGYWQTIMDPKGKPWVVVKVVRSAVNEPFQISQDFGWLGVSIFFLVSGYIITHIANKDDRLTFAIKRFFRIYPPFWVSIGIALTLEALLRPALLFPYAKGYTVGQILFSLTLLNYLSPHQVNTSPVAWTLIIEVLFYAVACASLSWIKNKPILSLALGAALTWPLLAITKLPLPTSIHTILTEIAIYSSYLPVLYMGQAIYYKQKGKIDAGAFSLFTIALCATFLYDTKTLQPTLLALNSIGAYAISLAYAYAIFVVTLVGQDKLWFPVPLVWISEMSYSLYLIHEIVGWWVINTWHGKLPYTVLFLIAVIFSFCVARLMYLFVEKPSQKLGRIIAKQIKTITLKRRVPEFEPLF